MELSYEKEKMMILRPFKKIREQEEEIKQLSRIISEYEREEKERKQKERSGNHKIGIWCNGCSNFMKEHGYFPNGSYETKFCKLDCKCEDRSE